MRPKILIDGVPFYDIQNLIDKYHITDIESYVARKSVNGKLEHMGGMYLAKKDAFLKLEEVILASQKCYNYSETVKRLYLTDYTLVNVEEILDHLLTPEVHDDIVYYPVTEVDELAAKISTSASPISDIMSMCAGHDLYYVMDLWRLSSDRKIDIFGVRNPLVSDGLFAFSSENREEVYDNLCVRRLGSMNDMLQICSRVGVDQLFSNFIQQDKDKQKTFDLMRKFYIEKANLSESPNLFKIAKSNIKILASCYNSLSKEIFDYTEDEVINEILPASYSNNKIVIHFFQYVQSNLSGKFAPNTKFIYRADYNPSAHKDLYSIDEWNSLYDYLCDIDIHINNAYNDRLYSQYWFTMLCYLTSALRFSDIRSLPSLGLDDTRFIHKYALINDPLTSSEAATIVQTVKAIFESSVTVKTGAPEHFYYTLDLLEPIGTAAAILEYHRIREDDNRLFTISEIMADRVSLRFKDIPLEFQTTKATKTLLSFVHAANQQQTNGNNALFLVSTMRAHSMQNGFSNTTQIYLQEANLQGDPSSIATFVCERGVFGWLYLNMLQFITGKISSFDQATTQVQMLRSKLNPVMLEQLSGFLQHAEEEQKAVLASLNHYTKGDISHFLQSIGTPQAASGSDTCFCIVGNYCSKMRCNPDACLTCPCSLKTTFGLSSISSRLLNDLQILEHTDPADTVKRQRLTYQIQTMLLVVMDAKDWFAKYDKHFINAFVNIPEIGRLFKQIPDAIFLLPDREDRQ